MTCYGCGLEGGDSTRLCPACIILRKKERGENVPPLLQTKTQDETTEAPALDFTSPFFKLICGAFLVLMLAICLFFLLPEDNKATPENTGYSTDYYVEDPPEVPSYP